MFRQDVKKWFVRLVGKCWSMTNKPSLTSTSWAPCAHLGNATGDNCWPFSELGEQLGLAQDWRGWWDWPKRLNWHYMCLYCLGHIFWFKQSLRWCNWLRGNFVRVARVNNNILRWLKKFQSCADGVMVVAGFPRLRLTLTFPCTLPLHPRTPLTLASCPAHPFSFASSTSWSAWSSRLEICQKIYRTEDFRVKNLHRKRVIFDIC